jgi:TBC1 domain family protein 5
MNPDTSYRQGMHELLAPIILVVEQDSLKSSPKAQSGGSLMDDILDEEFIEHDSFTLFSLNMRTAKSFYEMGDNSGREDLMPNHSNSSSIVERSKLIHEKLLARYDPELAEHLTRNEILPQIFLM